MPPSVGDVSSTQYVILAENQRKKKALAETKARYEALLGENRTLLEEREASQKESYEVTEFLRKEIVSKNAAVAALEGKLEEATRAAERDKAAIREEEASRLQEREREWAARLAESQAEGERLNAELERLGDFRARQAEIEGELERLRSENVGMRAASDATVQALERKFAEQATRAKKDYEVRLAALKKSAEEDIDERLDASVKRILQQNRRMAEELRLHVAETDELQRARDTLEGEAGRLQREVAIKAEMEEQFAKRGSRQARQIDEANQKVRLLERSLGQLTRDFARERSSLAEASKVEAANTQVELNGLRRLVALKTRELKNIRRLASEVVRQRSDVERFLVDSLDVVRREIGAQRAVAHVVAPGGMKASLPSIGKRHPPGRGGASPKPASAGVASAAGGARVDIAELSWEDREKVLRLLFSKVNNASADNYFASLPPHSFPVMPMGATPGTANVPTSVPTTAAGHHAGTLNAKYTPLGSASSGLHPDMA